MACALLCAVLAAPGPSEALLRQMVAETALAQLRRVDREWQPAQRDCAGLVRHAYRTAYRRLDRRRGSPRLWRDADGGRRDFADAASLLAHSFVPLGREAAVQTQLKSGDLLAFRQPDSHDGEPDYHLMLVVVPFVAAPQRGWVVYHPGPGHVRVRAGSLPALTTEAPAEWRPRADNPSFLGYFRFREWAS